MEEIMPDAISVMSAVAFFTFEVADGELELFDLGLGLINRDIARLDQVFVSRFRRFELFAVFFQLARDCLQTQRKLSGHVAVARLEVRRCLGAQIDFFAFQLAHLRHELFAQAACVARP
jgi:hypothetical protein